NLRHAALSDPRRETRTRPDLRNPRLRRSSIANAGAGPRRKLSKPFVLLPWNRNPEPGAPAVRRRDSLDLMVRSGCAHRVAPRTHRLSVAWFAVGENLRRLFLHPAGIQAPAVVEEVRMRPGSRARRARPDSAARARRCLDPGASNSWPNNPA